MLSSESSKYGVNQLWAVKEIIPVAITMPKYAGERPFKPVV